jgi:hypothetical protein
MAKSEYQKLLDRIAVAGPALKRRLRAKLRQLRAREAKTNQKIDTTPAIVKDAATARSREKADALRLQQGIKRGNVGAAPKPKPQTTSKEKQGPPQSDTYKVSGITYNRATGRPVKVDKGYEPVKAGDKRGGGPAPAPEKSARQKEIESIRADKSLSDMDKFVKANRKMIESVGTKRQREMLADYDRRHKPNSDTVKPDTSKVKGSNFGKKTGVDTSKYAPKNKERYDTSKVGGKFKKDLGVETGKYRVKSGSSRPKKRDTSKVKGSNFGKDSGVDTKDYELPNKNRNATLKFGTKVKGVDTEKYEVKNKKNFADKLKKVTGKFIKK